MCKMDSDKTNFQARSPAPNFLEVELEIDAFESFYFKSVEDV